MASAIQTIINDKMKSRINIILAIIAICSLFGCNEKPPKTNYELGVFPDTLINLTNLNSEYDDYNSNIFSNEAGVLSSYSQIIFSTNRHSSGGEFNLIYGVIEYFFGQTSGQFILYAGFPADVLLTTLVGKFNTDGNDFGPFRFFHHSNGFEYMFTASEVSGNGLDLVYSKYLPNYSGITTVPDPIPATLFNSSSDDAYVTFNATQDTAYFCSDRGGNFDLYMLTRSASTVLDTWLTSAAGSPVEIDSLKTGSNEKCPFLHGNYLFFTSDADGGYGGYDLYYSVFKEGKWSSPVNLGPRINSASDEYRPVVGHNSLFENYYLVYSSNRPGGEGGFDLYFTGLTLK